MNRFIFTILVMFCLNGFGAEGPQLKLEEVMSVIRTNMTDVSEGELNRAAAAGLIRELGPRVELVTSTNEGAGIEDSRRNENAAAEPISKTAVYHDKFGYVRIGSVDERLTNVFSRTLTQLLGSNKLAGIVLDLRFAGGTNYQAAAHAADEFVRGGEPLVRLGEVRISGTDRAADIRQPVAVLVNGETRAAAEALAGILRESAAALVIGSKTAGEARLYETFTLSTGQRLRVGKVPIEVGRGKVLPATGMVPDIEVRIGLEAERAYYEDAYLSRRTVASTGGNISTNGTVDASNPLNEAELVRRHRGGEDIERPSTAGTAAANGARAAEASVITDPALGRALDFLKGLSIVGPRR